MDRNVISLGTINRGTIVALRKESVDRNLSMWSRIQTFLVSLSARRAWIEMLTDDVSTGGKIVALRKESVDRNTTVLAVLLMYSWSLSARRAWIEIFISVIRTPIGCGRSPQGERG